MLNDLLEAIGQSNRMQRRFLATTVSSLSLEERNTCEDYLCFWVNRGKPIHTLAKAYSLIVQDTLKEQLYFARHGSYRFSTVAQVESFFQDHPNYMEYYQIGLALTTFLWPNHLAMWRHFRSLLDNAFAESASYLEIGTGHGLFFLSACQSSHFSSCTGIDINDDCVGLTRDLLARHCGEISTDWLVQKQNLLQWDQDQTFDFIVMGEVLEHVETPTTLLQACRNRLTENGTFWLSTCLNAPEIDHVFLFQSLGDICSLLETSGFRISDVQAWPYVGKSLDECMDESLPVNVACTIHKA